MQTFEQSRRQIFRFHIKFVVLILDLSGIPGAEPSLLCQAIVLSVPAHLLELLLHARPVFFSFVPSLLLPAVRTFSSSCPSSSPTAQEHHTGTFPVLFLSSLGRVKARMPRCTLTLSGDTRATSAIVHDSSVPFIFHITITWLISTSRNWLA